MVVSQSVSVMITFGQGAMIADDERHPDVTSWRLSVSKKPQPSNDRDLTLMVARSLMLKRAHSSGNERDFADIVCRLGKSRMAAKAQIKSMERRLREACSSPAATAKLITAARAVWAQGFGAQRSAGKSQRGPNWISGAKLAAKRAVAWQGLGHTLPYDFCISLHDNDNRDSLLMFVGSHGNNTCLALTLT